MMDVICRSSPDWQIEAKKGSSPRKNQLQPLGESLETPISKQDKRKKIGIKGVREDEEELKTDTSEGVDLQENLLLVLLGDGHDFDGCQLASTHVTPFVDIAVGAFAHHLYQRKDARGITQFVEVGYLRPKRWHVPLLFSLAVIGNS